MTTTNSSLNFRESCSADNKGLVQLVRSCPMEGKTAAYMDRNPDFFALPRLQGDEWRVYVSEQGGKIVGNFSYATQQNTANTEGLAPLLAKLSQIG